MSTYQTRSKSPYEISHRVKHSPSKIKEKYDSNRYNQSLKYDREKSIPSKLFSYVVFSPLMLFYAMGFVFSSFLILSSIFANTGGELKGTITLFYVPVIATVSAIYCAYGVRSCFKILDATVTPLKHYLIALTPIAFSIFYLILR